MDVYDLGYSLDDFFTSGSKKKTDETKQLFDFVQRTILNLAEVVDQLDLKVTGFEKSLKDLQDKMATSSSSPAAAPGAPAAAPGASPAAPGAPPSAPGAPAAAPGAPPSASGAPAAAPGAPPSAPGFSPAAAAPPDLPPLPGLPGSAPASSPAPASRSPSPGPSGPGGPGGPGGSPPKENPMAQQANLRGELADAFKKIRARLDAEEEE